VGLKGKVAIITDEAQGIGTAVFLANDDSAFISGQMIVQDGGLSFC
jgi:hypothetical protein